MTMMYHTEARQIIEGMRDMAVSDCASLTRRIKELKIDYETDPWEDTAKQIQRLEMRLELRVQEAKALAVAVTQFEGGSGSDIGPGSRVEVVWTSHSDLMGRDGIVQRVTPSGNYEVAFGNEAVILGPKQVKRA